MHEVDEAAYSCEKSAYEVGEENGFLNVDTEHESTLTVAADSVEITACLCPLEEDKECGNNNESDDDADFYVCVDIFASLVVRAKERYCNSCILELYESLVLNIERVRIDDSRLAKNIPARVTMNG